MDIYILIAGFGNGPGLLCAGLFRKVKIAQQKNLSN
jgi:hypothetical protein